MVIIPSLGLVAQSVEQRIENFIFRCLTVLNISKKRLFTVLFSSQKNLRHSIKKLHTSFCSQTIAWDFDDEKKLIVALKRKRQHTYVYVLATTIIRNTV